MRKMLDELSSLNTISLTYVKAHLGKCGFRLSVRERTALCGFVLASTNTFPAWRLVVFPPELLFLYDETEPGTSGKMAA